MTTLFENRQSPFNGVQENFVNTSAGNLTFLVRDLVRVGGMPIVTGRVYDSALNGGDAARDFGPGWKLAVRESLSERGGGLVYRDASNAEYLLEVRGGDIVSAVILRDGAVVARMDYDAASRLTGLPRPDGASTFGYGDHGLTSVDGAETARYRYEAGRVAHAEDAGGERGYAYTDDGVLASATAGGVETELASRPDGIVHELLRDGERLLRIEHRADGRVLAMAHRDGTVR